MYVASGGFGFNFLVLIFFVNDVNRVYVLIDLEENFDF
jgi:hypothetical protein